VAALAARDFVTLESLLERTTLRSAEHELLLRFPALRGGPEILDGPLLPYALHFGLARTDHPLARFAHAWVAAFAELPEWRAPARQRTSGVHDTGTGTPARKRTLDEDIMSRDVGAMLWVTGW